MKLLYLQKSIQIFSLSLLLFCVGSHVVMAQKLKKLTGTVLDAETAQPLAGASVNAGPNEGVITDINGVFSLLIGENNQKVKISFVGFQTTEVTIGNQANVTVYLKAGKLLDEVIITALGVERESKNLGFAVQQVDAREISKVKSTNFLDNLAGRVAGVNITAGTTGVGSSTKITIRGESSFTNANPLFVVDGIPINNNTIVNNVNDDAAGFQEVDFGNGAMDINPDDIDKVTVLKGPAAAALYGTRASNGVIIIKTKTGGNQKGIGVSFNSTNYAETPFKLPVFQNGYGVGNSGKFAFKDGLGGGINDNITYSYGPKLDAGLLIPQFDSPVSLPDGRVVRGGDLAIHGGLPITPTPFVSHPNNVKDFYQTGYTRINNLAFTAGNEKNNARLSLTDLASQSIIPGVDLKRKTVSAAFTFSPTSSLKILSTLNYVNTGSKNRPATKYGSENTNYAMVGWLGRSTDINSLKDYWQPGLENVQQYSYNYTFFDNPYFTLLENRNAFNRDRLFGNVSLKYDFTKELSLTVRTGMDYQNEDRTFRRAFSSNRFKTGAYAEQNVFYREINSDFLANYSKTFSDFSVDVSLGGNQMNRKANLEQIQTLSLAQPGVYSLANASSPLEYFQNADNKRINSFYGIAKFGFKNMLFVDITGRNDWSSALATATSVANTSFFYPSVSAGFVVSNAIKLPAIISFLKVRASYAQVGNDTNPFQTNGTFTSRTPVGGLPSFSDQNFIPNANLKPESITSVEFGADVRFFNDRLKLDVTYFNSLNKNQIISLPIAVSSGYVQQNVNGGAIRSKGLEAIVDVTPVQRRRFKWNTLINFTAYRNRVETLPDQAKTITLAYNRVYDIVNQTVWYQVQEGGRMGDMWGTGYLKNANGDFVINKTGGYIADNTLKKLGNYNPDFMVGFNNNFTYKNINAAFLVDWRQGGILVSRTLALAAVGGQLIETADRPEAGIVAKGVVNTGAAESPVYQPNTVAVSAETYYRQYYDRNHEENNTYNASYVKLREVQLGYQLPASVLGKHIQAISVSLVARNVFAISDMRHFDPEQTAFQGQKFLSGVEDMSYPTSRSLGVKLSLTF
ncbi:SusC/RagA family TonB-linked outer membrane protein [Runella aurantiaca]|uniref:SusC/RagA family TonB-linked outer membrane protein n=1 Tax=Runella aurantiaca TaxID=2282308 RepID=A0A369I6W8_9BACT|nr:SusC/RagA family TonB-linked outer membrane protein [Runella aurantiaca]RDB03253.1 SusC/RagA family TonB-linked outer membrane protein [Runella aurantiaca]